MMRQLQDGAILNQVRDVPLPERSLLSLTVAGQEQGKRPVLDPDADRVVVLVLKVLGRLRHHRQDDGPQFDLARAGRGEDRRYAAVTDQTEQFQVMRRCVRGVGGKEEPRSKGLDHIVHAAVVIGMVMADDHQINRLDASLPDQADDLFGWTGIDSAVFPSGERIKMASP